MSIKLFISLLSVVYITRAYSSVCRCNEVVDWEDLKKLINDKTHSTTSQEHLLICPFHITKPYSNSSKIIDLTFPIHIQCQVGPDDKCVVEDASDDVNLFRINSDNVWLEGFHIISARNNAVHVNKGRKNVKLIDMEFSGGRATGEIDAAIIFAAQDSSCQILQSSFTLNEGISIRNGGAMMIVSSTFENNQGAILPSYDSRLNRGTILNRKELVLTGNRFVDNRADRGPAIYSTPQAYTYDAGENCGTGNVLTDGSNKQCNGVHSIEMCSVFDSCDE